MKWLNILRSQKQPRQLLPVDLGKMAENIITQVAAIGRQRTGGFLDYLVELFDLLVNKFTGLVTNHQMFKLLAKIRAMQPQYPTFGVWILGNAAAFLSQFRINVHHNTADR